MPRILVVLGFIEAGRDLLPGEIHDVSDSVARREIASGSAVLAPPAGEVAPAPSEEVTPSRAPAPGRKAPRGRS